MASDTTTAEDAPAVPADEAPRTVTLHVLSPSLEGQNRLTFDNLPLTTTVGALKERITESIPSRPSAAQQRLIYRGKALLDHNVTLQNILEPSSVSTRIGGLSSTRDDILTGWLGLSTFAPPRSSTKAIRI